MGRQAQKLAWVQALRGIAAFMVVLVHSRSVLQGNAIGHWFADHLLLPMGMGVDLFFIISGFLMVFTTRDFDGTPAYAWRFAVKRLARIWPLFAVITVVAVLVEHGVRAFSSWPVLWPYLEGLLCIPHDPRASGIYFHMAVGVAWTLCFECYFYAVFALCMLFGRWRYRVMALWFAVTLLAIPLWRGGYNLGVASQPLVTWARYPNLAINPIVWEFVLGMLAGWLYLSDLTIKRSAVLYSITAACMVLLLMAWHRIGMVDFFGPKGWGAPLAIIFFCLAMRAKNGPVPVPRWLVRLGEISYSLYLVHVYVFGLMQRVVSDRALLFVARPIAALLCAWLVFRYVEAPGSAWMRKRLLNIRLPAGRRLATDRS